MATCWRPTALGSTRLVLAFGEHFELAVGLDPSRGAISSIELHSRLRPAAAGATAEEQARRTLTPTLALTLALTLTPYH